MRLDLLPLFVIVAGGATGAIYIGQKHLRQNNDVIVNKYKPRQWEIKNQYKNFVSRKDAEEYLRRKGFYP